MDCVIANQRCPLQVDLGIERITRVEIKHAAWDVEPAERQGGVDVLKPHHPLKRGMQPGPGDMEVHDRSPIGQVSANHERILGFHHHVEFPIADGRLRHGEIRSIGGRLWRRTARQSDRDQIDILEQRTVR